MPASACAGTAGCARQGLCCRGYLEKGHFAHDVVVHVDGDVQPHLVWQLHQQLRLICETAEKWLLATLDLRVCSSGGSGKAAHVLEAEGRSQLAQKGLLQPLPTQQPAGLNLKCDGKSPFALSLP